ncbi:sigma factor [Amycolatopsis sp. cg9]|uniref:sigma factor n=1 Tax=Amycolatopsis sp. cg9 TaxID=3238801 RepID=UPI0035234A9D
MGAMPVGAHEVEVFEAARPRLEAIAYRLLGSAADAEDAVQDTFLRWQAAGRELIGTPGAWLTKVLTNICLNRLTSARARRETSGSPSRSPPRTGCSARPRPPNSASRSRSRCSR